MSASPRPRRGWLFWGSALVTAYVLHRAIMPLEAAPLFSALATFNQMSEAMWNGPDDGIAAAFYRPPPGRS